LYNVVSLIDGQKLHVNAKEKYNGALHIPIHYLESMLAGEIESFYKTLQ